MCWAHRQPSVRVIGLVMLALTGPTAASLALKMEPTQEQAPELVTWGAMYNREKKGHDFFSELKGAFHLAP